MHRFPSHQQTASLHRIADVTRGGASLPAAAPSMAGTTPFGFSTPFAARAGTGAASYPRPIATGLGNAGGGRGRGGSGGDEVLEGAHRAHSLD